MRLRNAEQSFPFQRILTLALLLLFVATLLASSDIPSSWTGVEKIVAVGDLHGDYKNFITILKGTGVVNEDLAWAAGKTHLVQTGDIMDRGPEARSILDCLRLLEKQAEAAGGQVHALIGNHEMLNLAGIAFDYPGYVTLEQFLSFLPEEYRKETEQDWSRSEGRPLSAQELKNQWQRVLDKDKKARRIYTDTYRKEYGEWLLEKNTVIKINGVVFVHGGISEPYSRLSLGEVNAQVREELKKLIENRSFTPRVIYDGNGPLWYRDLARKEENSFAPDVDRILANLEATHMVIAHSPVGLATVRTMRRFQGKIWIIDTGISSFYGGHLSALVIENENIRAWGVSDE